MRSALSPDAAAALSETVKIEGEGGPIIMPRWEAFVRQIHTMALNRDASAARLIHQLRKQFPGQLPEGDPVIIVLGDEEMRV